jgi:hypothetical protein
LLQLELGNAASDALGNVPMRSLYDSLGVVQLVREGVRLSVFEKNKNISA